MAVLPSDGAIVAIEYKTLCPPTRFVKGGWRARSKAVSPRLKGWRWPGSSTSSIDEV